MKKTHGHKGFTLVEVLLSLFVISLFFMTAGGALMQSLQVRKQSDIQHELTTKAKSQLENYLAGETNEDGVAAFALDESEMIYRVHVKAECDETDSEFLLLYTGYLEDKPWNSIKYYQAAVHDEE